MKSKKYIKTTISVTLTVILSYGLASAWTNISSVSSGAPLTTTLWNEIVTKLNDTGQRASGIYTNSTGSVGIGTSLPTGKLDIRYDGDTSTTGLLGLLKIINKGGSIGDYPSISFLNDSSNVGAIWFNPSTNAGYAGSNSLNIGSSNLINLGFVTNNILRLFIGDTGNIGIGTTTPNSPLTVIDSIDNDGVSASFLGRPLNSIDNRTYFTFQRNGQSSWWGLAIDSSNNFAIHNSSNRDFINFEQSTGHVGIGTSTPSYGLDVNGTIRGYGITDSSDIRLKKDIKNIGGQLDNISKINGVEYKWKDQNIDKDSQIGVIAQDLEKIYPELVKTDDKGYKSVNYSHLVVPLIEAVKELKQEKDSEINDLKKQNKELLERIEKLENKIN